MEGSLSHSQFTKQTEFTGSENRKNSDKIEPQNYEEESAKNDEESVQKYLYNKKNERDNVIKFRPLEAMQYQRRYTNDSNNPFFQIAEINPSMIITTDRLGIIEYVNPSFMNTTGYLWQEVVGRQINMLTSGAEILPYSCDLKRAIIAGTNWKGELKSLKKSGEAYFISVNVSPVVDDLGFVTNFVVLAQDISSLKATKEQLEKTTVENKVLLAELHHRVKNNLAIITGLMQLQAFNEENESIQNKLFSGVSRIQTMATMHEMLYENKSFTHLDFGENMKNIVSSISKMYHSVSSIVKIEMEIEALELNINQAYPCSLIVNEVVSNVFKHAFDVGMTDCLLTLRLYSKNETVFIEAEDNGRGLPTNFEKYNQYSTLGVKLLLTLVRQIKGKYRYKKNGKGGTSFFLQFQKKDVRGSSNAHLN